MLGSPIVVTAGDTPEDKFRHHVLNALDAAAESSGLIHGWTDEDLPELFRAIDAQRERVELRSRRARGTEPVMGREF